MGNGVDCSFELTAYNSFLSILFIVVFSLALLGNTIVIITIVCKTHRSRSITNFYLLNLAVADLLRSVVCIPPTLLSELTHCWLLGPIMCKAVAYLQPVGVCASAYTLVVIAIERYYAICRPLESRKWHTKKRALITISTVWMLSFGANMGSLAIFDLVPYRAQWTCDTTKGSTIDFIYQLYVTTILLFVPLTLMVALYGHVIYTLNIAINCDNPLLEQVILENEIPIKPTFTDWLFQSFTRVSSQKYQKEKNSLSIPTASHQRSSRMNSINTLFGSPRNSFDSSLLLRSTNQDKILLAKRKVTRMLITIVIVFAACWVPSYTWWLIVRTADLLGHNLWHSGLNTSLTILTYISSMANPITYCFMNKSFRSSVFSYCHPRRSRKRCTPVLSHRTASREAGAAKDLQSPNIPLIKIDLAMENTMHI
ncbi:unnamed protein product [Auanema sp. JU1783]|nr:unnamed protein product [Auanema sp. JU1783]